MTATRETRTARARVRAPLPCASLADTLAVGATVVLPIVAQGAVLRRPKVVALAERLDADRRAGRLLRRLRARYGPGPLRLRVPGRSVALILSPEHVRRVLAESPAPFALASREKRAALSHFQPDGVLVSRGRQRADRRRFNQAVLEAHRPMHQLAAAVTAKVREEARLLLDRAESSGRLDWDDFAAAFWRMARRVVLGDAARDDHELTDLLRALRADANWAYLRPHRTAQRERFQRRLQAHLERAEPDSLAGVLAEEPATADTRAAGQVPHWLFAFDAAAIAAFRTLALLASHPSQAARARHELAGRDLDRPQELPHLRACLEESVRLWPTTLVVLRDSTCETAWERGVMPARTTLVVVSSFFHRDERTLPFADRFTPEIWLDGRAQANPSLIPFSAGPGACPGRNLVLLVTSTLLAALLEHHELALDEPSRLQPPDRLPRTLDHSTLRFSVAAR